MMNIQKLSLRNFRNAIESDIEFSEGVNVICGANAAGKTNILEAIFYFAAGKSFRNCKDRELIRFGNDKSNIAMRFLSGNNSIKMSASFSKGGRRVIKIGESAPLKMTEYIGRFRAVIFTPDHLSLVKGSPENRRRFLDLAICQSFPRYAPTLSEYNRVLAQKNALLKRGNVIDELLMVYNERLASLAAVITVNRKKYVQKLEEEAKKFLFDMSGGKEDLTLSYQTQAGDFETQEELREKYNNLFAEKMHSEKERFLSLYGAHKDDFVVAINKKSARMYGSQGQQRSVVLALKLAEGELSYKLTGEYPVFLLDDILSELDKDRKDYILSKTTGRQVIITGCESEIFESKGNKIFVRDGVVSSI
ncbi:MAG: DNA replication/repair protein RecF [Clostridia bacterium]|nr:DNA replication/repair protein RecF [Clostridia bacterium]